MCLKITRPRAWALWAPLKVALIGCHTKLTVFFFENLSKFGWLLFGMTGSEDPKFWFLNNSTEILTENFGPDFEVSITYDLAIVFGVKQGCICYQTEGKHDDDDESKGLLSESFFMCTHQQVFCMFCTIYLYIDLYNITRYPLQYIGKKMKRSKFYYLSFYYCFFPCIMHNTLILWYLKTLFLVFNIKWSDL